VWECGSIIQKEMKVNRLSGIQSIMGVMGQTFSCLSLFTIATISC